MSASVTVRVPGSTSNLGAGFDCVGVAVGRWLTLHAAIEHDAVGGVRIEREGTLAALGVATDRDRIVLAFAAACSMAGRAFPHGLHLRVTSEIPVARGLGSSASATVAGAAAANALMHLGFDDHRIIGLCAALEGHPDNVVPSILGGATMAIGADANSADRMRSYITAPIELHPDLGFAFAVPDFEVETAYMRAALPQALPHAVAVRAAGLAAALVSGLTTGHPGLLERALDDVLHVPYRRQLVRGYDDVVAAARRAGAYGATLSGSGSSVCAIAPKAAVRDVAAAMTAAWQAVGIAAEPIACEEPAAGYSVAARRSDGQSGGVERPAGAGG